MQLKQIKLAGFKSFVDPTIIPFPSQLVAVVGPNGCGKSNVIDAVRWVMGESSAKNLRGESMADVIFNGSAERKAVGQASVELIFDNSLGRIGGAYSSYQEISIERRLTRDNVSTYWLNKTLCRRRDITDIFLGTGAGARGYSIIGQGTISKIIEARPEELRVFIEEAAGVSKYKERKRETITRISHTRENLQRVDDIRQELGSHLQKLARQAELAKQHTELQSKIRQYKIETYGLKIKKLKQQEQVKAQALQKLQLEIEENHAKYSELNLINIEHTELQAKFSHELNNLNNNLYQLRVEIVRLEAQYLHATEQKNKLQNECVQIEIEQQALKAELINNKLILKEQKQQFELDKELLQQQQQNLLSEKDRYLRLQNEQQSWQANWDKINASKTQNTHQLDLSVIKITHLQQSQQQTTNKIEKIDKDLDLLIPEISIENNCDEQLLILEKNVKQLLQNLQKFECDLTEKEQQLASLEKQLFTEQDTYQTLLAEQKTLVVTIAVAAQKNLGSEINLESPQLLLNNLKVDPLWQPACEWLLGKNLYAQIIADSAELLVLSQDKNCINQSFTQQLSNKKTISFLPTLASKIQSPLPAFLPHFNKIFIAETKAQAYTNLSLLKEDESIITPDKYWFGVGWLRYDSAQSETSINLLASQQRLAAIKLEVATAEQLINTFKEQRLTLHAEIKNLEQELKPINENIRECREKIRVKETEKLQWQQKKMQLTLAEARFNDEKLELIECLEEIAYQQETLNQQVNEINKNLNHDNSELEGLLPLKNERQQTLSLQSLKVEELEQLVQKNTIQQEKLILMIEQSNQKILGNEQLEVKVAEKFLLLKKDLEKLTIPQDDEKAVLAQKLQQQEILEKTILEQKQQLENTLAFLTKSNHSLKNLQVLEKEQQNQVQHIQLELQGYFLQIENNENSLKEYDCEFSLIEASLATLEINAIEKKLAVTTQQLTTLGPINLAAVEEYETETQRKQFLDAQYDDLIAALTMLENAIKKIDAETTLRFQQTFTEINSRFSELFPRLFGGGTAYLALNSDNILEAGIQVMAQPKGKRNSSIHLLSGGEKALTAIALVFAIFQLNPSPFCMLDEVDAPLDEANVGRFCTLVKEMSQFVQFLFITHNKVTMELAEHLIGVTMREPGVSRIVTVDVEQALAFAEA